MRPLLLLAIALLTLPAVADVVRSGAPATVGGGGGAGGGGGDTLPVVDTTAVVKGSADATKQLAFEVDGFTTGTTRTITFPNASGTVPMLASNNTWGVATNTFTSTVVAQGAFTLRDAATGIIMSSTAQTPDSPGLFTGTNSNAWLIAEFGDNAFDFAHPQQTHPTLFIHSNAQNTTGYASLDATGIGGELFKALTESAATSLVQIPVASDTGVGGMLFFTIFASDGTAQQLRTGRAQFAAVAEGTTETCTITDETDGSIIAATTGTLTYTVACSTTPANAVELQINAVSSLTQTTLRAYHRVYMHGPVGAGVLPQ